MPELEKLSPSWSRLGWWPIIPPKLDIAAIAKRLRIPPRKAKAFINVNGPVALAASYQGRGLCVSPLELEAFEKAHRREILEKAFSIEIHRALD